MAFVYSLTALSLSPTLKNLLPAALNPSAASGSFCLGSGCVLCGGGTGLPFSCVPALVPFVVGNAPGAALVDGLSGPSVSICSAMALYEALRASRSCGGRFRGCVVSE